MHNFSLGLIIGIIIAFLAVLIMALRLRSIKKEKDKEIAKYKGIVHNMMKGEAEELKNIRAENEELRKANENLRVSLNAMREKPGRKEAERLQIMQKAIDRLMLNSPGFSTAWQSAVQESSEEIEAESEIVNK